MYNISKGITPDAVLEYFQDIANVHNRTIHLGVSNNFMVPYFKLEIYRRSFMYRGPKLWVQVPVEIKNEASVEGFKSGIKSLWRYDGDPGIT